MSHVEITDSRDPEYCISTARGRPFDAWYRVRSNLSHRGKAAFTDFELVERSVVGLHDALRLLLGRQLPLTDVERRAYVSESNLLRPLYTAARGLPDED